MIKLCKTCDYYHNKLCVFRLHSTKPSDVSCSDWKERGYSANINTQCDDDKIVCIPREFKQNKCNNTHQKPPLSKDEVNSLLDQYLTSH